MPDFGVAFYSDPFGVEDLIISVSDGDGAGQEVTAAALHDLEGKLLVQSIPTFLEALRAAGQDPPANLVDCSEAQRLSSGLSRDQGGERAWDIWPEWLRFFDDPAMGNMFRSAFEGRRRSARPELSQLLACASLALIRLWTEVLQTRLNSEGEWDRFHSVEVPTQRALVHRQHRGIAFSTERVLAHLSTLKQRKYENYIALAEMVGLSPSMLTYQNVGQVILRTDAAHLQFDPHSVAIEDFLRMAGEASEFARRFVDFQTASRDISALTQFPASGGRVYPTFQVTGTVTSRIMVANPPLQQLRRAFRDVLRPGEGSRIAYLDYSQFEPGILAALSQDEALIEAYNQSDVYLSLASVLFGDIAARPTAKAIFLGFLYGMSLNNIALATSPRNASADQIRERKKDVESFFEKYVRVEEFRRVTQARLLETGRVSTPFGNHRRRSKSGDLTRREQRWALTQVVQGTASLIFKNSITAVAAALGPESLLLPVHDAILLQIPEQEYEDGVKKATSIMIDCMRNWCPGIAPRVTVNEYFN